MIKMKKRKVVVLHDKRKITSLSSSVIPLVDALQCKIALMDSVSSENQVADPHVHHSCSLLVSYDLLWLAEQHHQCY